MREGGVSSTLQTKCGLCPMEVLCFPAQRGVATFGFFGLSLFWWETRMLPDWKPDYQHWERIWGLPGEVVYPTPRRVKRTGRKLSLNLYLHSQGNEPIRRVKSKELRGFKQGVLFNLSCVLTFSPPPGLGVFSFRQHAWEGSGPLPTRHSSAPAGPARSLLFSSAPSSRDRRSSGSRGSRRRAGCRADGAALGRLVDQMEDEGVAVPAARAWSGAGLVRLGHRLGARCS